MRNVLLSIFIFWGLISFESSAYEHRDYLKNLYGRIGNVFLSEGRGLPYPNYTQREKWKDISGDVDEDLIRKGEKYLSYQWKTIPLSAYQAFEKTGDRSVMESPYFSNRTALNDLIIAELVEGQGRFIGQIANGVRHGCLMTSWVLSAHLYSQISLNSVPNPNEQIIDIASAGYGATMALAWHFFKDAFAQIDPSINHALEKAVKEKILDPYLDSSIEAAHWWKALDVPAGKKVKTLINNWNPWCNSNVLICFLVLEKNPERFRRAIEMVISSVDEYINYVSGDGACEEGPAYWFVAAAKLYDCLCLLSYASGGLFDIFDKPLLRDMGEYIVGSYIGSGYVANFADSPARLDLEPTFIHRFGESVGSRKMTDFAFYLTADSDLNVFVPPVPNGGDDTFRSLESLIHRPKLAGELVKLNNRLSASVGSEVVNESAEFERIKASLMSEVSHWWSQTQLGVFRNSNDWVVAVKGGHNGESHNHNDVGSFILFIEDVPVFVDVGVGNYTRQTFSEGRYEIWTMQSDWHNLPLINGTSQICGNEFAATQVKCNPMSMKFSADISKAYTEAASCREWCRSYKLTKDSFEICDKYELTERILPDSLNFMVCGDVFLQGESTPGGRKVPKQSIVVCNEDLCVIMTYPSSLEPFVAKVKMTDSKLAKVWGKSLSRISFTGDLALKSKLKFKIMVF